MYTEIKLNMIGKATNSTYYIVCIFITAINKWYYRFIFIVLLFYSIYSSSDKSSNTFENCTLSLRR